MSFAWALSYPEVHKVCTLFNLTELNDPVKCSYTSFPAFIQDGPQCGLVALAMYLGNPSKASVESLLEFAKSSQYTNHGEIFSAEYMARLAKANLPERNVELYSGQLDSEKVKGHLLNGGQLLVPYDTEKDNSPGLLNGHKAHWALICGGVETASDFYVVARHGKARNVAIWRLGDVSRSNAQLNEIGAYSKHPDLIFHVPEGGISGGLKCKAVLLGS